MDNEDEIKTGGSVTEPGLGIAAFKSIDPVDPLDPDSGITNSMGEEYTPTTTSETTEASASGVGYSAASESARETGAREYYSGVSHVLDDAEREEYVSTKRLYEKTLGVTEYEELRTKLHLRADESFTDYYNRTGYIPEGFEMQARLLLAEEKRKRLYTEVQRGNMSEEDFLYEAYGKDLLKADGVDFESPLYWYQRYSSGKADDPRDNPTFLAELIEESRALFQGETWYEEVHTRPILGLASYVTGEVLDASTVAELFPEFAERVTEQYASMEQAIKYYRGGLLQGFDPTIDADGDGKIDFYYAPNGRLYNVNETGHGANTLRAVYNADGSLNRIVAEDSYIGEVAQELWHGIASVITDTIDFFGMVFGGLGDWVASGFQKSLGDSMADALATTGSWWSDSFLGDIDYVVDSGWTTSDGAANWANYGRQAANLTGYLLAAVGVGLLTAGSSTAAQAGTQAAKEGAKAVMKHVTASTITRLSTSGAKRALGKTLKTAVNTGTKRGDKKFANAVADALDPTMTNRQAVKELSQTVSAKRKLSTLGAIARFPLKMAQALTTWQYGFGAAGWAARAGSAATVALRDSMVAMATMSVNKDALGLDDNAIALNAFGFAAANFASGLLLRSVGDESALRFWANQHAKVLSKSNKIFQNKSVSTFTEKLLTGTLSKQERFRTGAINTGLDLIDTMLTAFMQTSLVTSGQLMSGRGIMEALSSPELALGLVAQSYQNMRAPESMTGTRLVQAVMDSAKMDTALRTYVNARIAEAENTLDDNTASALRSILEEYDQAIVAYTNTPNAEYAAEVARIKAAQTNTKAKAQETANNRRKKTKEVKADVLDQPTPNYTKAEAIIKALADLVNDKLQLDGNHALMDALRTDLNKSISNIVINRNEMIFKQIHADNLAYVNMARGFWKTRGANWLYGKQARDTQIAVARVLHNYYYNKNRERFNDWVYADPVEQLTEDLRKRGEASERLADMLADGNVHSDNVFEYIDIVPLAPIIEPDVDKKGTPKTTKAGAPIYKITQQYDTEAIDLAKAQAFVNSLTSDQRGQLDRVLVFKARTAGNTDDQKDGAAYNARAYLKTLVDVWGKLADDSSPLIEIGTDMYALKPLALGDTNVTLDNGGKLVRGLAALKFTLTTEKDSELALKYLKVVLSSLSDVRSIDEIDTIIENNLDVLPALFNSMADNKVLEIKDIVYLMNNVNVHLNKVNRDNNTDFELLEGAAGTPYSKAHSLINFLIDFDDVKSIIRYRTVNESLSQEDIKTIDMFIDKYSNTSEDKYIDTDISALAYQEHVISESDKKILDTLRSFQQEKVDLSIENLKIKSSQSEQSQSTNQISQNTAIEFLANRLGIFKEIETMDVPSAVSGQQVQLNTVGTKQDFELYLSSLITIPEEFKDKDLVPNTRLKNSYIKSTLDRLEQAGLNVSGQRTLLRKVLSQIIDIEYGTGNKNDIDELRDILHGLLNNRLDTDIIQSAIQSSKELFKHFDQLDNPSSTVVIDLNVLSSSVGAKISKKLETNKVAQEALLKAENVNDILNILFSTPKAKEEFMRACYAVDALKQEYPHSTYIELPVNSKRLRTLLEKFGYNHNVITKLTNGDLAIPGIYYNNNTQGLKLTNKNKSELLIRYLQDEINKRQSEELRKTITFSNPTDALEDFSSMITFADESTPLNPEHIILNSINSVEQFTFDTAEVFNVIETSIKQGKMAGALIKELLIATKGTAIRGSNNEHLEKAVKTFRIIKVFSELFDEKDSNRNHFGVQLLSKENAAVLEKTYARKSIQVKPFLFNEVEGNSDIIAVSLNPAMSQDDFLELALGKVKQKGGLKKLSQIIPIEISDTLHNNLTRKESTYFSSAYTTLSWVNGKLSHEMDVYEFIDRYETQGSLNLQADISQKNYNVAIEYLKGKSKAEVLNDTALSDNIFVQMQRNAYKASNLLNRAFVSLLTKALNGAKVDIDTVVQLLGNPDHRRNLGAAIQKALLEIKETLKVKSGYIEITDNLAAAVLKNLPKDTNNVLKTASLRASETQTYIGKDSNVITGSQMASINVKAPDINPDIATIKEILRLLNLDYSAMTNTHIDIPEARLLAMITSASHTQDDSLCISANNLFQLSGTDFEVLKTALTNIGTSKRVLNSLESVRKNINKSAFYQSAHASIELPAVRPIIDGKEPSVRSTSGKILPVDIVRDSELLTEAMAFELNRALNNAKLQRRMDQYVKISTVLGSAYQGHFIMSKLAKELELHVLPYVNNTGSLMMQNLLVHENLYYLVENIRSFASQLTQNLGIGTNEALNIAYNYYLYSTGMQLQSAHPGYILVDKNSGEVVDLSITGKNKSSNEGLLARLFLNYFETKGVGGLDLKESFEHVLDSGETINVKTKNIVAIKLNTNALSTTFKPGNVDIDIYNIGENSSIIANIFRDKAYALAKKENIDMADAEFGEKAGVLLIGYYYEQENANAVNINRKIANITSKEYFEGDTGVIADLDTISVLSPDINKQDLSFFNTIGIQPDTIDMQKRVAYNTAQQNTRDAFQFGVTRRKLESIPELAAFITAANRKIEDKMSVFKDSLSTLHIKVQTAKAKKDLKKLTDIEQRISSNIEKSIETVRTVDPKLADKIQQQYAKIDDVLTNTKTETTESIEAKVNRLTEINAKIDYYKTFVTGDKPLNPDSPQYKANAEQVIKLAEEQGELAEDIANFFDNPYKEVQKLQDLYEEVQELLPGESPVLRTEERSAFKKELQDITNELSELAKAYKELRKTNRSYKLQKRAIVDMFKDGRVEEFHEQVLSLQQDLAANGVNISLTNLAYDLIADLVRRDNSVAGQLIKLHGYKTSDFRNRKYSPKAFIKGESTELQKLLKGYCLYVDAEWFFDNKNNTHVYEVSLLYTKDGKIVKKATKYYPVMVKDSTTGELRVATEDEVKQQYKAFFSKMSKNEGTQKSLKNYFTNNLQDNAEFDALLKEANDNNSVLIGFNSTNSDLIQLDKQNILTEHLYPNLIQNHIDIFDIVLTQAHDLNMYGGMSKLAALCKQLGVTVSDDAHLSDADNQMLKDLTEAIVAHNTKQITPKLLLDIEALFEAVTGEKAAKNKDFEYIFDTLLPSFALTKKDIIDTPRLQNLKEHINKVLHDDNFFNAATEILRLNNERNIISMHNTLNKHYTGLVNKYIRNEHIEFAETFTNRKLTNTLMEIIAFNLRHCDIRSATTNPQEYRKQIDSIMYTLAKQISSSSSERDIITSLTQNKKDLFKLFDIDTSSEEYKTWRTNNINAVHQVADKLAAAYGNNLAERVHETSVNYAYSMAIKPVYDMIERFTFLSTQDKDFFKEILSNAFDAPAENYTSLESLKKRHIDALSNFDKQMLEFLMQDPLLTSRQLGIYRKAFSTTKELTLLRKDAEGKNIKARPQNMTLYLSEDNYRQLMGYNEGVKIDPDKTFYVGVIRYPIDKFDSMHYLKVELIKDANIGTVLTSDTMLMLNGDFDGDNIMIVRTDNIQSKYGQTLHAKGKYLSYGLLDSIMEDVLTGKTKPVKTEEQDASTSSDTKKPVEIDPKERFKIIHDDRVADHIVEDLEQLFTNNADYYMCREEFFKRFSYEHEKERAKIEKRPENLSGKYHKKLLEDMYIQKPVNLSSMIATTDLAYVSYLPHKKVLTNKYNVGSRRAIFFANALKKNFVAYNDTQSGMFQKGLINVDYSKYGDIMMIENAINLSPLTISLLKGIDLVDLLNNSSNENVRNLATTYADTLNQDGSNGSKLTLILKLEQLKRISDKEYKKEVIDAVKTMKAEAENDPAAKRFVDFIEAYSPEGDIPDELSQYTFAKKFQDVINFHKEMSGARFNMRRSTDYEDTIKALMYQFVDEKQKAKDDAMFNPDTLVPTAYFFDNRIKEHEDSTQWVRYYKGSKGSKDKRRGGVDALRHVVVKNIKLNSYDLIKEFSKKVDKELLVPLSQAEAKRLGIARSKIYTYYLKDINHDTITYLAVLNVDTAKTTVSSNVNTKNTPTLTVDIGDIVQDESLCKLLMDNDVAAIRNYETAFKKPEKIFSRFEEGSVIFFDEQGNQGVDLEHAIGFITKDKMSVLENTHLDNERAKPLSLEESAYGNNMLSSGAIGYTYGIFVNTSGDTAELIIDNEKYARMKKAKRSLSNYDRYEVDAKQLYYPLAVAAIIERLPEEEIQALNITRKQLFNDVITTNPAKFIFNHINQFQNIGGKVGKLLSLDLFNRIHKQVQSGLSIGESLKYQNDQNDITVTSANNVGITRYAPFTSRKEQLQGTNAQLYNLREQPNMTFSELINYMRVGNDIFLSSDTLKDAEISGMLLNKLMPKPSDPYAEPVVDNTDYKTGQVLSQYGVKEAQRDIFEEYDNIDGESYLGSLHNKFVSRTKNKHLFRDNTILNPSRSNAKTKPIRGMRLAKLLSSLTTGWDIKRRKQTILQNLNPDLSFRQTIHMPYQEMGPDFNVKIKQRRVGITPKNAAYQDVTIPELYDNIDKQRTSPYYYKELRSAEDAHIDIGRAVINQEELARPDTLTPEDFYEGGLLHSLVQEEVVRTKQEEAKAQEYRKLAHTFAEELVTVEDNDVENTQTRFVHGSLVGHKVFKESKYGLNQGIKIKDSQDIVADRRLRQVAVDELNSRRNYSTALDRIKALVKTEHCEDEFQLYAYTLALKARLKSKLDYKLSKKDAEEELHTVVKDELNRIGFKAEDNNVENTQKRKEPYQAYIDWFETTYGKLTKRFHSLLVDLVDVSTKYSQETNEPCDNIFMLLSPNVRNTETARRNEARAVAKGLFTSKQARMVKMNDSAEDKALILYNNYNVFDSLAETISGVSKRIAIVNNAERLKRDGVIDSARVQTVLMKAFSEDNVQRKFIGAAFKGYNQKDLWDSLIFVINHLTNKYTDDPEFLEAIRQIRTTTGVMLSDKNKYKTESKTNVFGSALLNLFKAVSTKLSKYNLSLDDAIVKANKGKDAEAESVIYLYKQLQDIYAQLIAVNKDACTDIATALTSYCERYGLAMVDKYGRKYSKDFILAMNETSLEFVPKLLERELSKHQYDFKQFIVMQALVGNVFFMDANLASAFENRVFVKHPLSKFREVIQKTSNWAVKMLMASPFKLIDRLIKFTLFDLGTLGTANPNILRKQGQAQRELRAFFSSRGGYMTKDLEEFINTQGISFDGVDFTGIISGDVEAPSGGLLRTYTNKVGDIFTFQTLFQRYAYWLATKQAIEKNNYSTTGAAYYLKNQLKDSGLTAGEQASLAMAQTVGSINDFPVLAKTFNRMGFVFTTFPLAALRWGIGTFRSAGAALHDLFTEGDKRTAFKWLAYNSGGIFAVFMLEKALVYLIAEMFGVDDDDEDREKWDAYGALPNVTQTIIQGEPIMDTMTSMNSLRELADLFVNTGDMLMPKDEEGYTDEQKTDILTGFIRRNIIGHANPFIKNAVETITQQDWIDDDVINTEDKYTALENVVRKASSYFIGSAGANAFVKSYAANSIEEVPAELSASAFAAINAELGNTKVSKENRKNYYKALKLINKYLYKDSTEFSDQDETSQYNIIKSEVYSLINKEASMNEVYTSIEGFLNRGYSLKDIRNAFKNVSILGKLSYVTNMQDMLDFFSEAEFNSIKTALAYENKVMPWLDDSVSYLNKMMPKETQRSYFNVPSYYKPNYYTNNYNPQYYSQSRSTYNYRNNQADSFDAYNSVLDTILYNQRQAMYAQNAKEDN